MDTPKFLVRRRVYIRILAGLTLCLGLVTYVAINSTRSGDPVSLAAATSSPKQQGRNPTKVTAELPTRLTIPKIEVAAPLEHIGLTPEGEMGIPKSPDNAAWFNSGPRPGERGSSVIAGHFGLKNNTPAIFDNLHLLQKGDTIYIEDEKKTTLTFVVTELRTYTPDEDASSVFTSSDGKAHLNLITCRGTWDKTQKSYSTRLVVFADRVSGR